MACKESYRPISALPSVARLFEKLFFVQRYNCLNKYNLIYIGTNLPKECSSRITCLTNSSDKWDEGIDNVCFSRTIFIGRKKAFDMEDHAKLCHKQELYGLLLNELAWFKFYFYNRKQYCSVGGFDCYIGNIDVDLPQGSCLKPLLFLIYINDLPNVARVSCILMT